MSDQPVAEASTYTTQRNTKTNINTLNDIQTCDPRNQAFALAFNSTPAGMYYIVWSVGTINDNKQIVPYFKQRCMLYSIVHIVEHSDRQISAQN